MRQRTAPAISTTPIALQRAISTERLLKTDKKTIVLEALGDGNFSLSAQGIDKPMTIMADEVFEVRANAKQLVLLRKSRDYDPSDHDAVVTVSQPPVKVEPIAAVGAPFGDEPIVIPIMDV